MTRYDLLYCAAAPLAAPLLAWRFARRGKYRESAPGMLGRRLPSPEAAAAFAGGSLWIHAVSVGETAAARAVAPGLRELLPGLPLVVSTVTETGQAAARKALPEAAAFTYFPLDFGWNVQRFREAYRPRAVVVMETELWPNFITMNAAAGTPVLLVNAKISDRSFPRYRAVGAFLRPIFRSLAGVCAQTGIDAERFIALGVAPDRVRVAGNVKFDLPAPALDPAERAAWRERLGFGPERRVVLAGSTHEGEETMILRAFREVRRAIPEAGLILCPRHPERFGRVWELIQAEGLEARRASLGDAKPDDPPAAVALLDVMGQLSRAYGLAEAGIVAGSWCAVGGHNLLEPAAHGVPVVYGPNMKSQREIHALMTRGGAGIQAGAEELGAALIRLLSDEDARRAEGLKGLEALRANHGSAARAVAFAGERLRAAGVI